jgi:hypothetical protein
LSLNNDGLFRLFKHAFQAAQQGKRENNAAILRLLKITAQEIGDRPDKGCRLGEIQGTHKSVLAHISGIFNDDLKPSFYHG